MLTKEQLFERVRLPSDESFGFENLRNALPSILEMRGERLRLFVFNYLPLMSQPDVQELMWAVAEQSGNEAAESFFAEFSRYYAELCARLKEIEKDMQEEVEKASQQVAQQKEMILQQFERSNRRSHPYGEFQEVDDVE